MTVPASWLAVVAFFLLAPIVIHAEEGESEEDESVVPTSIEELKVEIEKVVEEYDIPSIGIAIVDETGPLWIDAIGYADIDSKAVATENTMYRIGSTTPWLRNVSL